MRNHLLKVFLFKIKNLPKAKTVGHLLALLKVKNAATYKANELGSSTILENVFSKKLKLVFCPSKLNIEIIFPEISLSLKNLRAIPGEKLSSLGSAAKESLAIPKSAP